MTDLQDALDQIKARAEKATEGPWAALERRGGLDYDIHNGDDDHPHGEMWHREDAEFIAHARTDVPLLVAAVKEVMKEHRPVFAVYNWRDGLRYEEPCEECHGAKGEHPCGCWSRDEPDYRCYACETAVDAKTYAIAKWPCPTVRTLTDKLTGGDDG